MIKRYDSMAFRRIHFAAFMCAALLSAALCGVSAAQVSNDTVQWVASVISTAPVNRGSNATLEVSAEVKEGWHVYAVTQPPGGPTALRITLDKNTVAQAAGELSGTVPERRRDPSFDLETDFYAHAFSLRVPVLVKPSAGDGQTIPVSVRFQACSDRECLPPRTVHLSVPIDAILKVIDERARPAI